MEPAAALAAYIRTLPAFEITPSIDGNYGHMGATITDAVLQAGVNYKYIVRPRVQQLLAEHPEARTTSAFLRLLDEQGAQTLLRWQGEKKIATMRALIELLVAENVETEDALRHWLAQPGNLERLRQISGIKAKTAHYIQILLGGQNIAVDRHLFRFVAEAGLAASSYDEVHTLIGQTADLLGVQRAILDHSIWRYMSERVRPLRPEPAVATDAQQESSNDDEHPELNLVW